MRPLSLALLTLLVLGCGSKPAAEPPIGDSFVHETLPARCFSSMPGRSILPLGSDPDVFAMHYGTGPDGRSLHSNASLITRDGGRTFQKITGDFYLAANERRRGALGSLVTPIVISEDFWIALSGQASSGRMFLVLMLDGVAVEVDGKAFSAKMPDGIAANMVWKGDARRWIARSDAFLFSTRDGGASWEQVGPAPFLQGSASGRSIYPIAWEKDRAVHIMPQDTNRTFLSVRGQPRQELRWPAKLVGEHAARARSATFWNGQLVGSVFTEVLTTTDTQSWKSLQTKPEASSQLSFFVDRRNRLWAYPSAPMGGPQEPPLTVYRWEPDQEAPVIVDFDFGGLPVIHLSTPFELPDGRLRFVAAVQSVGRHKGTHRDVRGFMLCEAGPGITPGFEPVVTEPIEAAAAGHVALVERFDNASEQRTRLAISPSGRIFATGHQVLFGGPPDMPPVYEVGRLDVPTDPELDGTPSAAYGAGERAVGAFIWRSRSPSLMVTFDTHTGERISSTELPEDFDVYNVRAVLSQLFFTTPRETMRSSDVILPTGQLPPRLPGSIVFSGRHGALIEGLRYGSADNHPTQYTLRIDPQTGLLPEISLCYTEPRSAACIPHHETIVTDAELAPDGTLYLLDWLYGRVLALAPEATEYVEVARGFAVPQDLALRSVGEQTVVLVADGDVFAFVPRLGEVKVRGAGPPRTPISQPHLAERDRRDCTADGPCLDEVPEPGLTLSASNCLTGTRLGAQAGRVFAGTLEARVTEWSETRVCFQVDGEARDGLLRVVRADGVMANRLGYSSPGFVTEWLVPERITPRTIIRVKGRNLQNAVIGGAQRVASADGYVELRVPFPGTRTVTVDKGTPSTRELTVVPEVLHGCRVGAGELCELEGIGFGSGSTTQAALERLGHTATVGGQAATLTFWEDLRVRLIMPALPPGTYPVVLRHPEGFEATAQAEVPLLSPRVLAMDQPASGALRYAHSRPAQTELGVLVPADVWSYGTVNGLRTPLQLDSALLRPSPLPSNGTPPPTNGPVSFLGFAGLLEKGKPLHMLPLPGGYLVASQRAGASGPLELVREFTDGTPRQRLSLGMSGMQVSGAGFVGDRLVLAASSTLSAASQLIELEVGATMVQRSTASVAYSAFAGAGNSTLPAAGAWVTPRGVYFGSCRWFNKPAVLHFLPLTVNADGSLTFGSLQAVLDDANGRLLACNTTDEGLVWVRRDGTGEHVEQHTAAGMERLATLPATLPGVGESWTYSAYDNVPGVLDLARLPSGELLLVLNSHQATPRGLRLARRHSDGTFSFSAVIAPQTLAQPGERCIGPSYWANQCPRTGADGCAPLACSLRPWQLEQRATDRIGTAILMPLEDNASEAQLVYEVTATARTEAYVYGGSEIHLATLPVP